MDAPSLPLTTDEILKQCPRFRILLVGRTGVGKSSLINYAFNVDIAKVSHRGAGEASIETEIMSPQNERFVLHDSQGFDSGEIGNLQKVEKFLKSRGSKDVAIKDRVHAIWHCIQTPVAGDRVFETGDEQLLGLAKVPIIVIFTKFDKLVSRMEEELIEEDPDLPDADIPKLSSEKAEKIFEELCVKPLENMANATKKNYVYSKTFGLDPETRSYGDYRPNLAHLIQLTQALVEKDVEGEVWFVSAMAQRMSALAKINSSVKIGMKKYWLGLASGNNFSKTTIEQIQVVIHRDIVSNWNFLDPNELLINKDFECKIQNFTRLVNLGITEFDSCFKSPENIQSWIDVGAAAFGAAASPVIGGIGLAFKFGTWLANVFAQTPEVLRYLMGYIVNLTLVLNQLFLCTSHNFKPPRDVTSKDISAALEGYATGEAEQVFREICEYVSRDTIKAVLSSNGAPDKVEQLIRSHV